MADEQIEMLKLPAPKPKTDEIEMIPFFSIGDEVFMIPKKPKVNISFKYLAEVQELGSDIAAGNLLKELLGEEGFAALADYDDLEPEQLEQIMLLAQKHVMGPLEGMQGKSSRGRRK